MRAQAQMSQWRATGASSARPAVRSRYRIRIALLVGGVCLHAVGATAQNPAFTVPRIITPAGAAQPEPGVATEVAQPWQAPLVAGKFDDALAKAADSPGPRPTSPVVLPSAAATTRTPSVSIAKPQRPSPLVSRPWPWPTC